MHIFSGGRQFIKTRAAAGEKQNTLDSGTPGRGRKRRDDGHGAASP